MMKIGCHEAARLGKAWDMGSTSATLADVIAQYFTPNTNLRDLQMCSSYGLHGFSKGFGQACTDINVQADSPQLVTASSIP